MLLFVAKSGKKRDTGCPVTFALDTFGDRWTLIIIRDMAFKGYKTYGEFLTSPEGIATNVLADRLKQLEAEGIVSKSPDPDNHRSRHYRLTAKGTELVPVIVEMVRWSAKYDPHTTIKKQVLRRIEADRDAFAEEIKSRHRASPAAAPRAKRSKRRGKKP